MAVGVPERRYPRKVLLWLVITVFAAFGVPID